jgi:predicted DNA-binding transcriptional regulator YafY
MKSEIAKDYSMADRVAMMICQFQSGGRINVHSWAGEFAITVRQAYRDITVVDRYLPLEKETLDCQRVVYRRADKWPA